MELSKWLHMTKKKIKNLSQVQIIYNSLMQVLNEKNRNKLNQHVM